MPEPLSRQLIALQQEIEDHAREQGLDPFETIYEMLDFDEMNEVASFGGFPTRYPHWRFGMEYHRMSRGYAYGLHKIYELVINNDPCHAYLLRSNPLVDQKLVMAHVCGHSDFFRHNRWFSATNRKMVDEMANHGTRLRRYGERYGVDDVERFLDICLSLENLIDPHVAYRPRLRKGSSLDEEPAPELVRKLPSKEYMDRYVNPPDYMKKRREAIDQRQRERRRFPTEPERDILSFLQAEAPLENWQRDILGIVQEEALYYAPQGMTKIMNEGWASYWHSILMTRKILDPSEVIDYADHHSGTMGMRPGSLNPYKVGLELFRDIEDRWNRGAFGPEWEACDDSARRRQWDRGLGLGRKKIFEVRSIYNDVTFIDEFLHEDFARRQRLFTFEWNPQANRYEIEGREFGDIKQRLLQQLTNQGQPIIRVIDGNFENRGELLLQHQHEGLDLDLAEARDTLRNLHGIWTRPIHIDTRVEEEDTRFVYDGESMKEEEI